MTPFVLVNEILPVSLVDSAEKKAQVQANLATEIENKNYEYQGKLRSYNTMLGRKAKAETDISTATAQITALETAIGVLPEGKTKDDLEWQKVRAIRSKEDAERALEQVNESAIFIANQHVRVLGAEHNNLIALYNSVGMLTF